MMRPYLLRRLTSFALVVLLLPACSDSAEEAADTTLAPTTTETVTTTTTTAPTTTLAPATTSSTVPEPVATVEDPGGGVAETDLVYATWEDGSLTLDMHVPAEPDGAPIVVGGGIVEGLVEEGSFAVVLDVGDYVLYGRPGSPEELLSDRASIRAMADRYACAVRLARERASELGSDDPVVVLTGLGSDGGVAAHVALFGDTLEERWDEFEAAGGPPRQFDCAATGGSTYVDAVVGMGGTYDVFVPIFDGAFGRAYQQEHDPELQEFLSSAIGPNPDLEVRLFHGTHDPIPVEFTTEFAEMLADAGYDVQVATFNGGHEPPRTELLFSTITEVLDQ